MHYPFKNINFYVILIADLILFALAHLLAYLMRFELRITPSNLWDMAAVLPWIIPFKVAVFLGFGLYRGMWRYASMADLWRLLKATVFSSLSIIFFILVLNRFQGFSRAVFLLDGGFTFLLCGGLRMGIRMAYQDFFVKSKNGNKGSLWRRQNGKPILIVGAGDAGEKTLRELRDNPGLSMWVAGFIDDDRRKRGWTIHDVPILGSVGDLRKVVQTHNIAEVLIAMPSATGAQMRRIVAACDESNIRYRTLPGLGELIDGKVSVKDLRDVSYLDLLGRSEVTVNVPEIEGFLKDSCILVSGAGGSIGSELCRQILRFNPERLILMDASETNLYTIQMELKHQAGCRHYVTVLGNIRNAALLDRIFEAFRPKVVFHAAAYKHVPMLQRNPWQAVLNNIQGTQSLMEASINHQVENFVLVSTDKAVRPTNVMGASKRVCEMMLQGYQGKGTRMMGVRFGNVVGSSGSVIPLFRDQIARGGPLTITHPEITRYFMTIPEAAQLILQAGALGKGGEIFILEMGTPVKIVDLARDLIRLSGKDPDRDIEIVYTGLRPGEKLYEELITQGEGIVPTPHEKILVLKTNGAPKGFPDMASFRKSILTGANRLYRLARAHDAYGIRETLKELVPEYTPQDANVCILPAEADTPEKKPSSQTPGNVVPITR